MTQVSKKERWGKDPSFRRWTNISFKNPGLCVLVFFIVAHIPPKRPWGRGLKSARKRPQKPCWFCGRGGGGVRPFSVFSQCRDILVDVKEPTMTCTNEKRQGAEPESYHHGLDSTSHVCDSDSGSSETPCGKKPDSPHS